MIRLINNFKKINYSKSLPFINCNSGNVSRYSLNNNFYNKNNFNNNNNNNNNKINKIYFTTTQNNNNNNNNNHNEQLSSNLKKEESFNSNNQLIEESLKKCLNFINEKPNDSQSWYRLYSWMYENKKISVKLLSGEQVTILRVLIQVLIIEPTHRDARLSLCFIQLGIMGNLTVEEVEHPIYIFKKYSKDAPIPLKDSVTFKKYKGIELLLIILDLDQTNIHALSILSQTMRQNNIKRLLIVDDIVTFKEILVRNFFVSKDVSYAVYFELVEEFYPALSIGLGEGLPVLNFQNELIRGLNKFPNASNGFYFYLSSCLNNNIDTIDIPNTINKNSGNNKFTRIELIIKGIEALLESNEKFKNQIDNFNMIFSNYYSKLASYLIKNQIVSINGKEFDRKQLLVEAVNLNPNNIFNTMKLIENMDSKELVEISNKKYNRIDLANQLVLKGIQLEGYRLLSKIYQQVNDLENFGKYNKLYLDEIEKLKYLTINDDKLNNSYKFRSLYGFLKDGEKILVNGEMIDRKECLIRTMEFPDEENYPTFYYKLSQLLKDNNEKVKLRNGILLNKKDLLQKEIIINQHMIEPIYTYHIESDDVFIQTEVLNETQKDYTRLLYLIENIIKKYPEFAKSYLYIGQYLLKYDWESLEQLFKASNIPTEHFQPNFYINYSKRELFRKYLELVEPIYPSFDSNNFSGWFSLASEMSFENDKEFNNSKSQILMKLLEIDPNYSGIYLEFSKSLKTLNQDTVQINGKFYNKINLLLKSYEMEKGYSILKSSILIELINSIKDKNDNQFKIEFLNGKNLNKQQIIIELIENYQNYSYATKILDLLQELSNTMDYNNDDSIQINGIEYTNNNLLNEIRNYKFDQFKHNVKSIFKL